MMMIISTPPPTPDIWDPGPSPTAIRPRQSPLPPPPGKQVPLRDRVHPEVLQDQCCIRVFAVEEMFCCV